MDKKTLKKKNTSRPQRPVKLTVHEMNLVSPDRNAKDIGKLKAAIVRAESVTIPNRTQLYDLYHDITSLDGHIGGLIEKRINAVKNKLPGLRYVNAKMQKVDAFDILISSDKFSKLVEL
ncbi:MAG: hypothetical protein LBD53_01155, partial [Tannerella sp.]|nr:hypothetical protein [Tannerella sp.]